MAKAGCAQSVVGNGHLQQRERRCVCCLGAAKRGSLNHHLEGARLVAERRHSVLVDGREGVRADVGEWARASSGEVCWLWLR
jgi:hypothetical protein